MLYVAFLFTALGAVISLRLLSRAAGYFGARDDSYHPCAEQLDAESRLALGGKMRFESAEIYELELVPGISDSLAQNILRKKAAILFEAERLPEEKQSKALELAHGVGEKRAESLLRYLDLSRAD